MTENPQVNRNWAGSGSGSRGWKAKEQSNINDPDPDWKGAGMYTDSVIGETGQDWSDEKSEFRLYFFMTHAQTRP